RQIAELTGMSVSHVGVVIHKTVSALRKQLVALTTLALIAGLGWWATRPTPLGTNVSSSRQAHPSMVLAAERSASEEGGVDDDTAPPSPSATAAATSRPSTTAPPRPAAATALAQRVVELDAE